MTAVNWKGRSKADTKDAGCVDAHLISVVDRFTDLTNSNAIEFAYMIDPDLALEILEEHGISASFSADEIIEDLTTDDFGVLVDEISFPTELKPESFGSMRPLAYVISDFKDLDTDRSFKDSIRDAVSDRCPVLAARFDGQQLQSETQQAAGAWCPSPQQADDFADRMTAQAQGSAQQAPQQQRARARL